MKKKKKFIIGIVAFLCFLALYYSEFTITLPYRHPAVSFSGDSSRLRTTKIVPTLDTPVPKGQNIIWCASFQIAWDKLRTDIVKEPLKIKNAQETASRLNKSNISEHDLPSGSFYAKAGFTTDGIEEEIVKDMQKQFPSADLAILEKTPSVPDSLVAFAYLQTSVSFTLPFLRNTEDFFFHDSSRRKYKVNSFGIRKKDSNTNRDLRAQIEVLHYEDDQNQVAKEFALDLCRYTPVQVIVALIKQEATLSETLSRLKEKIGAFLKTEYYHSFRVIKQRDILLVPEMNYNIQHHFSELEGHDKIIQNQVVAGYWVEEAVQNIQFALDRSGARLASWSSYRTRGYPRQFLLDQPFLIIMKKRDAKNPFFVMWVDNAELLIKTDR